MKRGYFMTNLTFEWQIDEFMVYCQSKQLRPKSMQSYEQALRLFQRWCLDTRKIENVDEVKENDVRRYIFKAGSLKLPASVILALRGSLWLALCVAVQCQYIAAPYPIHRGTLCQ